VRFSVGCLVTKAEERVGLQHVDCQVDVDDIVGSSIHTFHKDKKRVEKILNNVKALPHTAEFRILTEPWTQSRRVLTYELLGGHRTPAL